MQMYLRRHQADSVTHKISRDFIPYKSRDSGGLPKEY